jgi:hypothetical protein
MLKRALIILCPWQWKTRLCLWILDQPHIFETPFYKYRIGYALSLLVAVRSREVVSSAPLRAPWRQLKSPSEPVNLSEIPVGTICITELVSCVWDSPRLLKLWCCRSLPGIYRGTYYPDSPGFEAVRALSFRMWHRVVQWMSTNVSKEHVVCILTVEKYTKEENSIFFRNVDCLS